MSKHLAEYAAKRAKVDGKEKPSQTRRDRRDLALMRREARLAGAELKDNGRGGLSPALVLKVMRRDEYRCKIHGDRGEGDNGGLSLHHKGGIVASARMSNLGHKDLLRNLVTVCERAHDELHDAARAEGIDSSQVEPEGDKQR
jgi:hypothetical protein